MLRLTFRRKAMRAETTSAPKWPRGIDDRLALGSLTVLTAPLPALSQQSPQEIIHELRRLPQVIQC